MTSPTLSASPVQVSKKGWWTGAIMSALPVLLVAFSAVMKFMRPPAVVEGFNHLGLPSDLVVKLGVLQLICALIYVIPRTAVLGAILLTAYFGGAIATTLRVGDPYVGTILFGVLVWGGLFLRDPRLRQLLPLRK
jgi:hypothetical protein